MDFLPKDSENDQNDIKLAKLRAGAKKPGGTFASMALSRPILKAVERKGYKLATPIQRKCIPPIMAGRDVVAMARTGSGKSAAFLLPLIDKLKIRQPKADIRALILSPTRELATQTLKFVREFTKYTNLLSRLIIGGESIARDFETITSAPDILVATPGRLAHVLVEMKQKLNNIEIVVFDEADRLFEPGFKEIEQVNEICQRLNDSKQTLLFSATMPQKLAEFAKAGLKNPIFVRLDVEANLSETLRSIHLHCNHQDKFSVLLYLLRQFIKKDQMTVVFMPTRHHIEYTKMLLDNARIECCHVYSSMDPEARKINVDKFTKKSCRVMLVTDIAARGIDIPLLDVVINFNFPYKPKLYVHRVGRVARAGRSGSAISLVSHDETAYLHALHVFLGLPISLANDVSKKLPENLELENLPDKVLGSVPQSILDSEGEMIQCWHQHNDELLAMVKVCTNAMKPYLKTREPPAAFSVNASKEIHRKVVGIHPLFRVLENTNEKEDDAMEKEADMLDRIKSYKAKTTIFEIGHIKGNRRTEAFDVMQKKRQRHDEVAMKKDAKQAQRDDNDQNVEPKSFLDSKFGLKYQRDDFAREKGLEISDLKGATLDLIGDDEDQMKRQKHQTTWDRKRKKYVKADQQPQQKKIKTESGAYISASYKSGLFDKWKNESKFEQKLDDEDEITPQKGVGKLRSRLKPGKGRRGELKNPDEIFKDREKRDEQTRRFLMGSSKKRSKNQPEGGPGKERRQAYRPRIGQKRSSSQKSQKAGRPKGKEGRTKQKHKK